MQSSRPDIAETPQPPASPAASADANAATNAAFDLDVDKIVANALADVEAMQSVADSVPAAPEAAGDDFSELEKQIQALLNGGASEPEALQSEAPQSFAAAEPSAASAATPSSAASTPPVDLVRDALEQEPIDPLLREIDAALADDADALLRDANGDIDSALRSVFDERALTGQEEEINRALIEAFGTSRVDRPSFAITNPLPNFEGAARELPSDIPRTEKARHDDTQPEAGAGANRAVPSDDAAVREAPSAKVSATTASSAIAAAAAAASAATATTAAPAEASAGVSAGAATNNTTPAPAPSGNPTTATATTTATGTSAATSATTSATTNPPSASAAAAAATASTGSSMLTAARAAIATLVALPLRALAAPARFMPAGARTIVGIAAITLVLWTPVAWWLAQNAARTPAVGPITIKPAAAAADAGSGGEASKDDAAKSGASGGSGH
jgi:hypothetical protein